MFVLISSNIFEIGHFLLHKIFQRNVGFSLVTGIFLMAYHIRLSRQLDMAILSNSQFLYTITEDTARGFYFMGKFPPIEFTYTNFLRRNETYFQMGYATKIRSGASYKKLINTYQSVSMAWSTYFRSEVHPGYGIPSSMKKPVRIVKL